jgi:hypothetical protein
MDRILPLLADAEPGVYMIDENDMLRLVHDHLGGEYALTDVIEFFELGTAVDELAVDIVEFDRFELRELKSMANAYKLSYPEEFIAMCLEIHEAAIAVSGDSVRFYANF